ncbi:MAG: NTPase [Candidatus Aureabacteria bacterium]|nr:NTPase [Candidatus Auribacterota bacterium]
MRPHLLLTGKPRSGKTTLVKAIVRGLKSCGGFYTEEILRNKERIGFRIKTLGGEEGILAMEGLRSQFRLGKYGINLKDLEDIGVASIEEALKSREIVVIDEIGTMELFSHVFKASVVKALDSDRRVIAVIHRQQSDFLNAIKSRRDVVLFEVSLNNHQEILERIALIVGPSPAP